MPPSPKAMFSPTAASAKMAMRVKTVMVKGEPAQ